MSKLVLNLNAKGPNDSFPLHYRCIACRFSNSICIGKKVEVVYSLYYIMSYFIHCIMSEVDWGLLPSCNFCKGFVDASTAIHFEFGFSREKRIKYSDYFNITEKEGCHRNALPLKFVSLENKLIKVFLKVNLYCWYTRKKWYLYRNTSQKDTLTVNPNDHNEIM